MVVGVIVFLPVMFVCFPVENIRLIMFLFFLFFFFFGSSLGLTFNQYFFHNENKDYL